MQNSFKKQLTDGPICSKIADFGPPKTGTRPMQLLVVKGVISWNQSRCINVPVIDMPVAVEPIGHCNTILQFHYTGLERFEIF